MADILSQEEINALIDAYRATGGAEETSAADKQVRVYDFARPDKFCKEHLRALNHIHSKHGASLGVALGTMLRVDCQVTLLALDQLTYKEYGASIPEGTLLVEVNLDPLTSLALFEFNPSFVNICVDLLAGGMLTSEILPSSITDIHKAIMRPVVNLALARYADSWAEHVPFTPGITGMTTESASRQVLLPSEAVLICGYEVSVGEHVSMISICMPASAIEASLPALTIGRALSLPSSRDETVNEDVRKTVDGVLVDCRAVLGRTHLPLADIANLEVGDLIRLPTKSNDPTELWVENVPAYTGNLGRSGQNLAVKIQKTLNP